MFEKLYYEFVLFYPLQGSLDEPTQCLVMHKTEPSQLQSLSLQLADKLHNLVENNDRVLDQKPFFQRNMLVRFFFLSNCCFN